MADDFIKIKPKIGPIEFDFNVLWRKLTRNEKTSKVAIVADRFLRLFTDHGVVVTQIQHFLPQIMLNRLNSLDTLLASLNNETLDEAAKLFKIRRQWLDGVDDQITILKSMQKCEQTRYYTLLSPLYS